LEEDEDDEGSMLTGKLCDFLEHQQKWCEVTNFTSEEIEDLLQRLQPYIAKSRKRGPQPKSTWGDHLICYLTWANLAQNSGFTFKMKESQFSDNVGRIRPILKKALMEQWWGERPRPVPLENTPLSYVGLLVDATTIQVYRPYDTFEKAMIYWDGKNHIYGLKKEVAVQASKPHYALFTSEKEVGSVPDFQIHKNNFQQYLQYLIKLPNERNGLPHDLNEPCWAILGDQAYVGEPSKTPNERRMYPKKNPHLTTDRESNKEMEKIRVPVEHFFGRLKGLWGILRETYRWDHSHFDDDFDICVLLTNEHIRVHELLHQDYKMHKQILSSQKDAFETKERKRKLKEVRYKQNKLRRLKELTDV